MITYYTVRLPENDISVEQAVSLLLKEFYTNRKFLLTSLKTSLLENYIFLTNENCITKYKNNFILISHVYS